MINFHQSLQLWDTLWVDAKVLASHLCGPGFDPQLVSVRIYFLYQINVLFVYECPYEKGALQYYSRKTHPPGVILLVPMARSY